MASSGAVPTLFCSKCGQPTAASAQYCQKCGAPLPIAPGTLAPASPAGIYGGFWIRVAATLIDGIIIGACCIPLVLILLPGILKVAQSSQNGSDPDPAAMAAMMGSVSLFYIGILAVNWLYEALMTSSAKQGTVGKMVVGLKVVDMNGQRISFARATGRHFGKILSGMVMYIGFIMVAFTDKKQGLHDMIAGTLVVKK